MLFSCFPSVAAELSPGVGPVDWRALVDPRHPPWNAVAKIQTNTATRCTGVLVGPVTVLTAAHCLYNRRTRALLHPESLHVLFGYSRGDYLWHGRVADYSLGRGFDEAEPARHPGSDWARLKLAATPPVAIEPLQVASNDPASGTAVALSGYSQDRAQVLMADLSCNITGAAPIRGVQLLTHDCAAAPGTSGAPLLVQLGDRWEVVGINIAVTASAKLALPATALADSH